jgi:hypothetical protein
MRKVVLNRWFLLSLLLTVSLSAFSLVAYRQHAGVRDLDKECSRQTVPAMEKGEMLWDALSRQFTSVSF